MSFLMCSVTKQIGLTDARVAFHEFAVSTAAAVDPALGGEQTQILTAAVIGLTWRELACAPHRSKISFNINQFFLRD